jgi:hypothetical protein
MTKQLLSTITCSNVSFSRKECKNYEFEEKIDENVSLLHTKAYQKEKIDRQKPWFGKKCSLSSRSAKFYHELVRNYKITVKTVKKSLQKM